MADKKISALTASSTPLAGTEVLPIVQSSATVKVAVSNLTAGRAVSAASLTLTTPLAVANGGTNASTASITSFNNITGFTASGTTGTTSTNLVFDTTPTLVGDVTLSTGNLAIGTSGKGIDFSITSHPAGMTSELLADYEEGTWTPTDTSGAGLTFTNNGSQYTKIGRAVTVNFEIVWPVTVDVSAVSVSLPFTANATNRGGLSAFSNVAGEVNIYTPGTANFNLFNDTGTAITNAVMSGKYLIVSLTYFV